MAFCTSCGKEIDDGSLFCEHCGARQEQAAAKDAPPAPEGAGQTPPEGTPPQQSGGYYQPAPPNAPPPNYGGPYNQQAGGAAPPPSAPPPSYGTPYGQQPGAAPPPPRKPMPKGAKITIIAVAAVVVVLVLAAVILGKVFSAEGTIETFVQAMEDQDYAAFSKVTCAAEGTPELTEQAVAPFLALYSNSDQLEEGLYSDYQMLKRGQESQGNGIVRLVEHNYILFKTYEVEVSGAEITFVSPLDDTQLTVGGSTLAMPEAESEYTLTVLPGQYDLQISCTNEVLGESFTNVMEDRDLSVYNNYFYLEIPYSTVIVEDVGLGVPTITFNGSTCSVDGFDEYGEIWLFPLPQEGELVVTYDMDGISLSDTYAFSDYVWEYFYPDPTLPEEAGIAMLEQVGQLAQEWVELYNNGDLEGLTALYEQLNYSPILDYYVTELTNSQDYESSYRAVYHYTIRELYGDLNWTREYGYDVPTFTTLFYHGMNYTYEYYVDGVLNTSALDPSPYPDDSMLRVTVQLVDGDWEVISMEYSYYDGSDDMETPYYVYLAQ